VTGSRLSNAAWTARLSVPVLWLLMCKDKAWQASHDEVERPAREAGIEMLVVPSSVPPSARSVELARNLVRPSIGLRIEAR